MEAKIIVRVEDTVHGPSESRGYRTFGRAVKAYTELSARTERNGHNRVVMVDVRRPGHVILMAS
jgi:hypothetical protein